MCSRRFYYVSNVSTNVSSARAHSSEKVNSLDLHTTVNGDGWGFWILLLNVDNALSCSK